MSHLLTAVGEEYIFTNDVDGATLTVGLYDDSTDNIGDGDDYADINSEPDNSNYSEQTSAFSVQNPSGTDVVVQNDSQLTFDLSDNTSEDTVDSYYVRVSFQSTIVNAEGSANDHIVYTGPLSKERTLDDIDTLNVEAGGVELEIE